MHILKGHKTIRSIVKEDGCKSVNITIHDWYDYDKSNLEPVFHIFGNSVLVSDLYRDGCFVKVKQKRMGMNPTSLKVVYYHPKYRMAFTFAITPGFSFPDNYMDMPLKTLIAWVTNKCWFKGVHQPGSEETFERKVFVPVDREMDDLELLEKVNSQIIERLGEAAWTPPDDEEIGDLVKHFA